MKMKYGVFSLALLLSPVFLHSDPEWVSVPSEVPSNAVYAGSEAGVPNYVCRSSYQGGIHPGKYLAGFCNIEFAGQEVVQTDFEVLTADTGYFAWVPDSLGGVGPLAFQTGSENGQTLYSCRAEVFFPDSVTDVGMHAGKLVGPGCNIPYAGVAYHANYYDVLSTMPDTNTVKLAPRWNRAGLRSRLPVADAYGVDGRILAPFTEGAKPANHQIRLIKP